MHTIIENNKAILTSKEVMAQFIKTGMYSEFKISEELIISRKIKSPLIIEQIFKTGTYPYHLD
jgi:hypothetical protein